LATSILAGLVMDIEHQGAAILKLRKMPEQALTADLRR
jgi:hypothetical protein